MAAISCYIKDELSEGRRALSQVRIAAMRTPQISGGGCWRSRWACGGCSDYRRSRHCPADVPTLARQASPAC
jgi:hypothetical protein